MLEGISLGAWIKEFLMLKKIGYFAVLSVLFIGISCAKFNNKPKKTESLVAAQAVLPAPVITHEAHLSSDWYNHVPTQLSLEMDRYLSLALDHFYVEADPAKVRALVVPHAGYYYSGLCAATAYQTLLSTKNLYSNDIKNQSIKRVIILAPSHTKFFNGVALPYFNRYKTVFGDINVDDNAVALLAKTKPLFSVLPDMYKVEHSLEMQLPWLQKTIQQFTIVPLIVGNIKDAQTALDVAKELKKIIDEKTLVVVSSDFVHHGDRFEYNLFRKNILNQVRMVDSLAVEAITKKSYHAFEKALEDTSANICGRNAIKLLLTLLEDGCLGNVEPRFACYYTSAHLAQARKQSNELDVEQLTMRVPDDKARDSVSYVGMVFTEQKLNDLMLENRLTGFEKKGLLSLARETLDFSLKKKDEKADDDYPSPILSAGMNLNYGAFVTLKNKNGDLRGCIGHTYAYQPLVRTIVAMTKSAAFNDDRFAPVEKKELDDLTIDITVLSQPQRIAGPEEIIVGKHGVIMNKFRQDGSMASAVFLPQVAREQGWDLPMLLEQLSIKAGLELDDWRVGAEFLVFEGHEFSE